MSRRHFLLLPVVCTAILIGSCGVQLAQSDWTHGFDYVSLIAKCMACAGVITAARSFARGDYMRHAFSLYAITFVCLVIRDIFALVPPLRAAFEAANAFEMVWRILFVVANLAGVSAAFMLARAAKLALFDAEEAPYRGILWQGLAWLIGLVLTGPAIVVALTDLREGRLHSFVVLFGSLADLSVFVLAVPVVRLAYALRGGLLGLPWTLIAAARICWLIRDSFGVAPAWLWQHGTFVLVAEIARTLACTCDFSAGLAFRHVFGKADDVSEE